MTIIREEILEKIAGNNRTYKKAKIELKCDHCNKIYMCPENQKTRAKKQEHHFCSKECVRDSNSKGLLKGKREKTMLERYGNKSFTATKEFQDKFTANCLKKYGVKSHLEVPEILNKIRATCLEKYGQEAFAGSEAHKSKLDYQEIVKKAWKTKLKNKRLKNISSKQEEGMYFLLCEEFGSKDIVRGQKILNQFVDFYIKSLDVYVQIDGIYWHGLNRPLEVIKNSNTRHDKKIYKQVLRDRQLNNYCQDKKIKLVRITDEEFDSMSSSELLLRITEV